MPIGKYLQNGWCFVTTKSMFQPTASELIVLRRQFDILKKHPIRCMITNRIKILRKESQQIKTEPNRTVCR
jgi:hypothetical protein